MLTRHWRGGRNKIMNKSIVQYYPEKTQILFFDLEFYVPENDREGRLGLKANPYKNGHFLIGGTFLRYFPLLNHEKNNIKKEFWIWNYNNSEKEMLKNILKFVEDSWNIIKRKDNQAELFFSGIGISRVDIQYLFARCHKFNLRSDEILFDLFYKSRFLDLETIVIPYFKNKDNMMKTKSTKEILSKFKIERERGASANIWEQYDKKDFAAIQERNINEVSDLPVMYKKILNLIHFSGIINKYSSETFEKKLNALIDSDDYEFYKQCYVKESDDWYYLNKELTDEQKEKVYKIQLEINKA